MNILVTAALAFFFAVGLGLAAAGGIRAAWRGLGRRRGVSAALAAFAVIATICAQKPGPSGPTITIDALLRDAGCYATNDVFHAAVSNAPAYAAIDFSACPVLVYARERGQTNAADWFELTPRRTFSALPADYAIANATNYNYMVYLDYVPPSPVHTNGVFELHGFVIENEAQGEPDQLAAGFINSRTLLPPPTARDYIQDGLIAMWDGIENAGWGIHDSNAVIWVNLVQDKWHLAYNFNSARIEDNALFIIGGGYGAADISTGPPPDIWSLRTIEAVFKWDKVKRYNAHFIFSANPYPGEVNTIAGSTGKGLFWEGNSKIVADIRNENGGHQGVGITANQYINNTIATVSANFGASFSEGVSRITLNGSNAGATTGASRVDRGYFRIGGATGTNYSLDNGAVYCIRVYSRLLTDSEIEYNNNIDKRRFNQ